jgi:hypothetical protein
MAEDQLRAAFAALQSRLQAELEAQHNTLQTQLNEAVAAGRREAEAELDARWSQRLDALRAESRTQLQTQLRAAGEAAEARLASEVARVQQEAHVAMEQAVARARKEADQASQEAVARMRREAEQAAQEAVARVRREGEQAIQEAVARVRREAEQANQEAVAGVRREAEQATQEAVAHARAEAGQATQEAVARARREAEEAAAAMAREAEAAHDAQRKESEAKRAAEDERVRHDLEIERGAREQLERACTRAEAALGAARDRFRELESERDALVRDRDALKREIDTHGEALARTRETHERELAQVRSSRPSQDESAAAVHAAERDSQLAALDRLLAAVRAIDGAQSLIDALTAALDAAALEAPRAALYLANGGELQLWRAREFPGASASIGIPLQSEGVVPQAARTCAAVSTSSAAPPPLAGLPEDRAGLAVPILVGGQAVAVLYADDGAAEPGAVPTAWPEAVQVIACHVSTALAHLTAVRTAQALRASAPRTVSARPSTAAAGSEEDNSARRYARLLVAEIKLYNEAAVRAGREKRDLLARLGPEIERARRLYEERVPTTIGARSHYFQQELVQTLADGDPALLGAV